MDITEMTILHHVGIIFLLLWILSSFNCCHPIAYFISLIYLYQVHERYITRTQKKLQFEERKQAYQKRVLSDSETVRWLNHAIEKIWPVCMEPIVSQKILLPIIPWFLEKYKPWTAKEALVQHLYMGRNPPIFTDIRVLRQSTDDDHLVLELGMNFLTADDMSAILAVKLRKRLGFGMWAKLHITGMHIEGKVLVGVKFLREWPFLGRLRVCFVEPPYFQMTVKPVFTHGLDVTELPGIAGWLDKLLSIAFEQTLVEPNMLVVDMAKFASPLEESWFSVNEKDPIAYAKVEVVEASNMKPSDLNGLADPYIKGQLGPYRFKTKIQKKTLAPKWHEEFKIPIFTWESPNVLSIEACDKDHFVDDSLGDCTVNINDLRDGERHDMWLSLQNIKMGRLHLAITILDDKTFHDDNAKGDEQPFVEETLTKEDIRESFASDTINKGSFSSVTSEKSPKFADNFEPINIEGQKETGIWVHHPGSNVAQTWEPRKGKSRRLDTRIHSKSNDSFGSFNSAASGSCSSDENPEGNNKSKNPVRRGLMKLGSVFHRSSKTDENNPSPVGEPLLSPHTNLRALNMKKGGVKFIVDENQPELAALNVDEGNLSPDGSGPDSPSMKDKARTLIGKSARGLKHALSRKGSRKSRDLEKEVLAGHEYSDEESLESSPIISSGVQTIPVVSNPTPSDGGDVNVREDLMKKDKVEGLERIAEQKVSKSGDGLVKEELKECLEGEKDKSSS